MRTHKVLLVDDEQAVRKMLAALLEKDGFSVVTASSAATATAILDGAQIDVVVTDLRMESPLEGFEVVRAARRMVPRPAIVVLTAFPVPTSDWTQVGADALIVKGMNTLSLVKELKALLAKRPST
jgi:DNA-binding response OmpR family regulator